MNYGTSAQYINNGTGAFTIGAGYGPPQSVLTLNMSNYINANDLSFLLLVQNHTMNLMIHPTRYL